ncbi:hypothetical protein D3C73_1406040 [compost metagenome]
MAQPVKGNTAAVAVKEIQLITTPSRLPFRSRIPAAQPPIYVKMKVALGNWIKVVIDSKPLPYRNSTAVKHISRKPMALVGV